MLTEQEYKILKGLVEKLDKRFAAKPIVEEGVNVNSLLKKHFEVPANTKGSKTVFMSASEVQDYLRRKTDIVIGLRPIGLTMRVLGFTNEIRKGSGKAKRGYSVIIKK